MVRATIFVENKKVVGFKISGHAGYGKEGKDIVCSAVSAIAFTALGTIDELIGKPEYTEKNGELSYFLFKPKDEELLEKAYIILETIRVGLIQIQESYSKYIKVDIKEGLK